MTLEKTVKVFEVQYSYNKKLKNENNFKNSTQKIEENLTLEGKITIFKTLAISKIIHLASVTVLPNSTITRSNKIYKECIGNPKRPKIKEKTLLTIFDKDGLKDLDILCKITTLQCS